MSLIYSPLNVINYFATGNVLFCGRNFEHSKTITMHRNIKDIFLQGRVFSSLLIPRVDLRINDEICN